jgi:alpha-galactosidase
MKPNFSFKYNGEVCTVDTELSKILQNGVAVSMDKKEYSDFDAVEWVLSFENNSSENSGIFSEILDCDTILPFDIPEPPRYGYMPVEGNVCVISMRGMVIGTYYWENDKTSATEYNFDYEYLGKRKTRKFANVNARSSDGTMPFFDVTANGCGYIVAIGWTGDWKAEFTKTDNGVSVKTGLKETCFYLMPDEKIRTSSILIMKYESDEDKHNKFRRLIKKYFSHTACTKSTREGLMAFELWGGITSEEMIKRVNELAKYDIKFEDIWIDAGWYGNCTKCDEAFTGDWSMHTGEWEVNPRAHSDELLEVRKAVENAGMRMMLWFEPERAVKGTKILAEHPDWFLTCADDPFAILNYGNREALDYACGVLMEYVEKLNMSCYRQDFNVALTKYFKQYDGENRRGITEIKHIMGMYEFWDRLHERFPELIIDNCSSGGRRIDIEALKRSVAFFRSDYQCNFNANPEVLQTHNSNISCYLPYNGCTNKTKSDTYSIRSSYSSSWGGAFYNAIFQSMTDEDFVWAKKICDEYRSIRKYMSKDFYNHGSRVFDTTSWAIWQYHDDETESGIVMAFRRTESPFDRVTVEPKGFLKGKTYTFTNLDSGESQDITDKLEIVLPEKRSCTIFEYKAK